MKKASSSRVHRTSIEKLEDRIALAADRFENNDSLSTAYNLGSLSGGTKTYTSLTMDDVADFYKFELTKAGTANTKVHVTFVNSEGNLDLALHSANGSLVRSSATSANQESVSLSGLAAGTYFVKVNGKSNAQSPNYKLTLTTINASPTPLGPTVPPPPVVPPVVIPPAIDLVGSALNADDSSNFNSTVNVSARVSNTGTANAGAFNVQYYLSRDNFVSIDDILLTDTTGYSASIVRGTEAGGESELVTSTLILPPILPTGWTGDFFYIVMRTDSSAQIVESNELNNSGQAGQSLDWEPISIFDPDPNVPPPVISQFTIKLNLTGMNAVQQQVFKDAARRWSQIIIGDLPNQTYNGVAVDDLLIDATLQAIDGVGGTLANAGPDSFRLGTNLPYHGSMRFDTADIAAMEEDGTFLSVVMHEMGHVLGIGTIWDTKGLLINAGTANPRFRGATATAEYNIIFGQNDTGVPVENTGGDGTRDSHWRESILTNELMTGSIGPGIVNPISRITVGSLKDLGYFVNMNAAEEYPPAMAAIRASIPQGSPSGALLSDVLVARNGTNFPSIVRGEPGAYDQAMNSLVGALSNVASAKNGSIATVEKMKSDSSVSVAAVDSVRKSYVQTANEVFANESVYQSSRSFASLSNLSVSTRKSSPNLIDTLFASEF